MAIRLTQRGTVKNAHEHTMLCFHSCRLLWLGLQMHQEPPLQQLLHVEQRGTAVDIRPPLRQRNPNLALRQRFIVKPNQQPAQQGTASALASSNTGSPALRNQSNGRVQGMPSTPGRVPVGQGAASDGQSASSASMPPGMQLQAETQDPWLEASHRSLPPAPAAGARQAGGSSASLGAAGQPRAAPMGVSAAVAWPHRGSAIAGQAGVPCASSGTAGQPRAAMSTGPAAATAQKHGSTAHPAGLLRPTPASVIQHAKVLQPPAPTSAPGGAASRSSTQSFPNQGCDVSQATHRPLGGPGYGQASQPHATRHLPGSGTPAAKPLQAAARPVPSGPQPALRLKAASAPAATTSHQGAGVPVRREAGDGGSGVMPSCTAAAGPRSEPAARLQGFAPPELNSHQCIASRQKPLQERQRALRLADMRCSCRQPQCAASCTSA